MCRWFAYISETEPILLEDVLILPSHSLSKQVEVHYLPLLLHHDPGQKTSKKEIDERNRIFNIDGMGVAWYTDAQHEFNSAKGMRPSVYKTIQPAIHDINFQSICQNNASNVCFAHVRASSGTAVATPNNHPFVFGRHTFMHNGSISHFTDIKREVSALCGEDEFANIGGSTDSEHFAALYMTYLCNGKGKEAWEITYPLTAMRAALHKAVQTVIGIQKQKLGSAVAANSLNLAATDGEQLLCYRFRNHAVEQPPSLYFSTTAGVTYNRKYPLTAQGDENPWATRSADDHGAHVIVASEPTTYKEEDWKLIEKNTCLMVDKKGGVVMEPIPYRKEWDAETSG